MRGSLEKVAWTRLVVVLAVLGLLVPIGTAWAADPLRVTANVQATKMDVNPARTYTSPALLIDPDNPVNVFAAAVDMRSRKCVLLRSGDGGATWALVETTISPPSFPFCFHTSGLAPQTDLEWGRDKSLYYLTVGWDTQDGGNRRNQSVLLAKSTDLGKTWKTTLVRSARGLGEGVQTERNIPIDVVVDTKSGDSDIVYVGWRANWPLRTTANRSLFEDTSGTGVPNQAAIAVSTNGGSSFSEPIYVSQKHFEDAANMKATVLNTASGQTAAAIGGIDPGKTGELPADRKKKEAFGGGNPYLALDDKGTLFVYWQQAVSTGQGLRVVPGSPAFVSASSDRGKTFTTHEAHPPSQFFVGSAPWLKWSKQGGSNGTLHLVYEEKENQTAGGDRDIYYKQSTDGGKTWSEGKLISDDDPKEHNSQVGTGFAVAPNGRLDVAWYDFRASRSNATDIYYTSSTDNGKTWLKNVRISDKSSSRDFGPWSNSFDMRQPVGVASVDSYALIGWDDTRNTDPVSEGQDVYTAAVQYKPVAAGLPNVVKYLLAGLAGIALVGLILLIFSLRGRAPEMAERKAAEREAAEVK